MLMSVEQSVECLPAETEVLGENLPKCLSLIPPQIPHDLIRARTLAAAVGIALPTYSLKRRYTITF
jgi:hypothetical protein